MKDRSNERIELLNPDEMSNNVLIDLSSTGAALIYHSEQKKGTRISLKIKDYKLDATVIYCQQRAKYFRVGVHFASVPSDLQKNLKQSVEEFSRGVPLTCELVEQGNSKKE